MSLACDLAKFISTLLSGTQTTGIPAACPDITPLGASSNTRIWEQHSQNLTQDRGLTHLSTHVHYVSYTAELHHE